MDIPRWRSLQYERRTISSWCCWSIAHHLTETYFNIQGKLVRFELFIRVPLRVRMCVRFLFLSFTRFLLQYSQPRRRNNERHARIITEPKYHIFKSGKNHFPENYYSKRRATQMYSFLSWNNKLAYILNPKCLICFNISSRNRNIESELVKELIKT